MPDTILNYAVIRRLGEGARSSIYEAQDPETKQLYAIKRVVRKRERDLRYIEQVENEHAVSHLFNHPNLRRSIELKLVRSRFLRKKKEVYLVMEYVEGNTIDVVRPGNMLAIVDTFIQAAQGLKAMHAMGYAHCDIKPNNIVRSDTGAVKLIDFGQACRLGTVKDRIQGTPDYIAPEQVTRRPISAQTDIFNLGATLYWALTGKAVPTLYTVNKSKMEHRFLVDHQFAAPIDLNPEVPIGLSNLVVESVATKQSKRPADMDTFITRLELAKHMLLGKSGTSADRAG